MPRARRPIADYGVIGDTRTAALIGSDGSIDWMCVPRFDGPPLFGRLVGGPDAGAYRVGPSAPAEPVTRRYRPGTATIETTWSVCDARLTLTEGMVSDVAGRLLPTSVLVRQLRAEGAPVTVEIEFDPRLGTDRRSPRSRRPAPGLLVCSWGPTAVSLSTSEPIDVTPAVPTTVTVDPGRPLTLVLSVAHRAPLVHVPPDLVLRALRDDEARWRRWSATIDPGLPAHEHVVRSLITLRLLTYSPSNAPVAATTTSLPEALGGGRNWDYRFTWPRDASIGIGAFLGVGKHDEALGFLAWLRHASRLDRPRLPVLLSLDGRHPRAERVLESWPGYACSQPVRIGNAAAAQHQLDGYGWVLDAAWLLTRAGHVLDGETWRSMAGFADHVACHWREPDAGIWEVRDVPRHHVHSKLMAWVCLDRAIRISDGRRGASRRRHRWCEERDALAAEIRDRGFDTSRGTYTRAYDSDELDAALLVLPLVGFEPPGSPRVRDTVDAIARELDGGGPLVYRYPPGDDGIPGGEGAFLPCAFWLVQALARIGRVDEAAARLDALIDLASPLGLFSEEIDPTTGEHLGNTPQALTHAALVQAALAIAGCEGAAAGLR
jgi:GH15 family glucan-1,4-alpha-glucosidase